jgi:hypothetical protein
MGPITKGVFLITPLSVFIFLSEGIAYINDLSVPRGESRAVIVITILFLTVALPLGCGAAIGYAAGKATARRLMIIFSVALALYFIAEITRHLVISNAGIMFAVRKGIGAALSKMGFVVLLVLLYAFALEKWTRRF